MTDKLKFSAINKHSVEIGIAQLTNEEAKKRCWHFSKNNCISTIRPIEQCDLADGKCHRTRPTIIYNADTDTLIDTNKH